MLVLKVPACRLCQGKKKKKSIVGMPVEWSRLDGEDSQNSGNEVHSVRKICGKFMLIPANVTLSRLWSVEEET